MTVKKRLVIVLRFIAAPFIYFWMCVSGGYRRQMQELFEAHADKVRSAENNIIRLSAENRGTVKDFVYTAVQDALSESDARGEVLPIIASFANSVDVTLQHSQAPLVIAAIQARIPVWIWGDAGSGKTTTAQFAADQLGLKFRFISVCQTTSESKLLGYMDGNGVYHRTTFREVYEHGGVFLIDEIDNGHPSVLAVLNSALANDHCSFPDANVKRHEDAVFIAAANTIGHGANRQYIGRTALDATTLDRFVYVRMDIDEALESALVGKPWSVSNIVDISTGGTISRDGWLEFVQSVRKACAELGIRHLVTPRASLYGEKLRKMRVGRTHLEQMCVWKGLGDSDRAKVCSYLGISEEGRLAA